MRSLLRLVFVLVFLSLFLWLLPAGQTPPTATLFGPETFLRGKGSPVTETWQFSTGCFQGPFLFHLRNGDADGKNRVSSAEVWLDGRLLFGPSDFSQKVSGYDIVVELKAQSVLEVRLASSPGSKLKIWIEGTPGDLFQYESITLYPTGGRYRLSNGIEMEIPEGAVSSPVSVTLRRILKEEVDPLMQSYGLTQKYFLAGYQGEPHGFLFNRPITLRLPSEPLLNGRDVPFRFSVDREHGAYCFASREQFIEADELPIAKIEQNEPEAVKSTTIPDVHIAQSPPCVPTCDSTRVLYSEEGWVIEGCTSGLSEDETDYAIIMITDPAASCLTSPLPCTCGNVFTTEEAKTDEAHTVGGYDCIVTGITGYTTFCGCAGYPTFAWELKEEHKPVITWSPEEVKIQVGERKDLEWDVVDAEGMPIRGAKVTATTENKDVADEILFTEHTGGIIGKSCGSTRIKLTTLCDTTEYIDVTVEMPGADIVIDAPDTVVETCGTLKLSAKVYTKDGVQIVGQAVEWSTSDATLATVSPAKGVETTLTAKEQKGAVEVIARACDQENRISITIEQKPDSIVISPPGGTVEVKKTLTLSAVVSDKCKNPISNATVDWRSLNESIATVGNGVVTGVSVGTATISATCSSLRAEAQVTVTPSSTPAEVGSVEIIPCPLIINTEEGGHVDVKIKDTNGNELEGLAVSWTIPGDGIISFNPTSRAVSGVRKGTCDITATCEGISTTCTVIVTQKTSPPAEGSQRYMLTWKISAPAGEWEYKFENETGYMYGKLTRDMQWLEGYVIFDVAHLDWQYYDIQSIVDQSLSMGWHETQFVSWAYDYGRWREETKEWILNSADPTSFYVEGLQVTNVNGFPQDLKKIFWKWDYSTGCPGFQFTGWEGFVACGIRKRDWRGSDGSGTEIGPTFVWDLQVAPLYHDPNPNCWQWLEMGCVLPSSVPFNGTEVINEKQTWVVALSPGEFPEHGSNGPTIWTGRAKIVRLY